MSRVSSAETKHRCIEGFFAAFPTPSACMENCEPATCLPIIDSLALFENRYTSIVDITRRFLSDLEVRLAKCNFSAMIVKIISLTNFSLCVV